jgi:hypothetical protein
MRRLTTLALVLASLGCLAGCGGGSSNSGSSGSASFATAEHAWEACKGGAAIGHEDPACKPLAVKACSAATATTSDKQGHGGLACEVAEGRYSSSQGESQGEAGGVTTPAQEHTTEEEQHRKDNLEAEGKATHEEEALQNSSGGKKACEEERRTQEKLKYEHPNSAPEPQREAEDEKLCDR